MERKTQKSSFNQDDFAVEHVDALDFLRGPGEAQAHDGDEVVVIHRDSVLDILLRSGAQHVVESEGRRGFIIALNPEIDSTFTKSPNGRDKLNHVLGGRAHFESLSLEEVREVHRTRSYNSVGMRREGEREKFFTLPFSQRDGVGVDANLRRRRPGNIETGVRNDVAADAVTRGDAFEVLLLEGTRRHLQRKPDAGAVSGALDEVLGELGGLTTGEIIPVRDFVVPPDVDACISTQVIDVPLRTVARIERNLQNKIFDVAEQDMRRRLTGQHFHSFVNVQESQREERERIYRRLIGSPKVMDL